jgi:hypothetical protein
MKVTSFCDVIGLIEICLCAGERFAPILSVGLQTDILGYCSYVSDNSSHAEVLYFKII